MVQLTAVDALNGCWFHGVKLQQHASSRLATISMILILLSVWLGREKNCSILCPTYVMALSHRTGLSSKAIMEDGDPVCKLMQF